MECKKKPETILLAICSSMFFLGFQVGGLQLMVLQISEDFALSPSQAGILISAQYLCTIAIPLIIGLLSDRIGKKYVLISTQILYCIGCVGVCASPSYYALAGSTLLVGAGYGAVQAASCAVLTDVYGVRSSKYQNLAQCMFSLSAFLAPLFMQYTGLLWRSVFGVSGFGIFICSLGLLLGRYEIPNGGISKDGRLIFQWKRQIHKQLLLLMLCMILCVGLENGITYFSSLLFAQRNWGNVLAAYALSAFWIAVTIMRLVFSMLNADTLKLVSRLLFCLGLVLLLICQANHPFFVVVLFGIAGGCISTLGPSLIGRATMICPSSTGIASSLMISASGIGSVIMPIIMGGMANYFSITLSYLGIALFAFCGSLLTQKIRQKYDDT